MFLIRSCLSRNLVESKVWNEFNKTWAGNWVKCSYVSCNWNEIVCPIS
jgi:hypothetical protein